MVGRAANEAVFVADACVALCASASIVTRAASYAAALTCLVMHADKVGRTLVWPCSSGGYCVQLYLHDQELVTGETREAHASRLKFY
ncbi:hypothetical protein PR001_g9542 [Phytophthora rubi]|uniref:Uncharacterized protein n=1 Tax=Phytophthora rubi TaxID=129364 RepID=A0A6A3MP70_9STRA|nr:hypothetical protein PR001_g9542 [Phytophthora rubi]